MQKIKVCTGSEHHTTERRGGMVSVDGVPIYQACKPVEKPEWVLVGNKGKHGKWCIATYLVPDGAIVKGTFTANGKPDRVIEFVAGSPESIGIDFDGYDYAGDASGWVVVES